LGLLYILFSDRVAYQAEISKVDPTTLQSANIETLKEEIGRYRGLLDSDVCARPGDGLGSFFPSRRGQAASPREDGLYPVAPKDPSSGGGFAPVAPAGGLALDGDGPASPGEKGAAGPGEKGPASLDGDGSVSPGEKGAAGPGEKGLASLDGEGPVSPGEKGAAGPERADSPAQPEPREGRRRDDVSTEVVDDSLFDDIEAATVLVIAMEKEEISMGTGFFVSENLIMTNRHVVEGSVKGGGIFVINKSLGRARPARLVLASRPKALRDYAVLKVDQSPEGLPKALKISGEAKRAERVSAWGYPGLVTKIDPKMEALLSGDLNSAPELVYAEGVVSVVQRLEGGMPLISHTAEVSQGNSGGPLIGQNGEVLGINTFIRVDDQSNRQVNVALGGSDILAFLTENDIQLD
jgi:hypothetical protein